MSVFERRRNAFYKALRKAGFDKSILGEPVSILYFTGTKIKPYERFYGLMLDARNESCVMINPSLDKGCMKGTIPELIYLDSDGPTMCIKQVLVANERVAIDTHFFTMATGEIFRELGIAVVDVGDIVARLRMYKDDEEIRLMQQAADIVEDALVHVSDKIRPGMTEKELTMTLYLHMAKVPGFITYEFIITALAGANSANPHGVSGDCVLKKGDLVLLDFCAYYRHYWSDITRCFFLGHVGNPKLEQIYGIVRDANLAAIAAVKPGVQAKEIDHVARNCIIKAGYGEQFLHRTGHGLGLSIHEEPYITSTNELILQEGMTFTIEPGIYIEGVGGIRLEDDILVTKDGCRVLTSSPKELGKSIICA